MAEFAEKSAKENLRVDSETLRCRFYENQYPEPEEVVMVNVEDIGEMGAYVTLLEYDNIEGMILLSELSRRRIRSINKLVRVNRTEVVMVIRVDKEKGYIDLSKRRVDPVDVGKCEERYNKAKSVHSILRHVADMTGKKLEELYTSIGWPLYRKYKHAYDAFKMLLSDTDEDIFEGLEVEEELKQAMIAYIKRKLAPQAVKVRADIEVTCFTYEGIDAIKEALMAGEGAPGSENQIVVKLIAPPMYVMTCMTLDKDVGIAAMNAAIETITNVITSKGGSLDVKMAPKTVTLREETELQLMLDRLALEQEDVDGDEDEDA